MKRVRSSVNLESGYKRGIEMSHVKDKLFLSKTKYDITPIKT